MQQSAVVLAPVNNVVIDNDVAPSHHRYRIDLSHCQSIEGIEEMDGIEGIEGIKISKVSKVSNSGHSIPQILKYRDTTKYRYQTFTSIAILLYIEYRTSTTRYVPIHLYSE